MANEFYNIYCKGQLIFSHLTEEEYFDRMEDLSQEVYETGSPSSGDLNTEIIRED